MKTSKCSLCLLVTTFSVVASIHSHAQPIVWAGASNSLWGVSNNWVGNVVPTSENDVIFNVTTGMGGTSTNQVNTGTSNPNAKSITVDLASFRMNADNSRTITLGTASTAGSFILTENFTTGSSVFDANSNRSLGVTFYDNLNLINRGTGLASVGLVGPVLVQTRFGSSGAGTITFGGGGSWSFLEKGYLGQRADATQTVAVVLSDSGPDIFTGVLEYGGTNASILDTLAINSGTYRLNNATTIASSGVTVGASGTLGGNGTISGAVTVAGTLAPGLSPGTLNFTDNLTLNSTATLQLEVTGIGAGQFDILNGDGANTLTLGGILAIDNTGYSATFGDSITVFTNWNSITGSFDSITGTGLGGGLSWDTTSLYSAGVLTVVPEPSTTTLLVVAGILIAASLRRRSRLA
jgi:hypothetical protein